jgi:hypothetical protein
METTNTEIEQLREKYKRLYKEIFYSYEKTKEGLEDFEKFKEIIRDFEINAPNLGLFSWESTDYWITKTAIPIAYAAFRTYKDPVQRENFIKDFLTVCGYNPKEIEAVKGKIYHKRNKEAEISKLERKVE